MIYEKVNRAIDILLFVALTLVFGLGFAFFAGPFIAQGLITRGQFVGLVLLVVSGYATRWLLSGRLR